MSASLPNHPSLAVTAKAPTLTEIHDSHADFVWRSLQRLGVPQADLEDALQEVFLVVHKRLKSFDHSSRITTWLFGIALRVAAAQRRRAHRRYEQASDAVFEATDASLAANPERGALLRERVSQFEWVLDKLGLERRAVFVMYEVEGISAVDIADMLELPVGTVYSRLSTARAEFSAAVQRLEQRAARGKP